ncbi:MAG: hypothetical protein OEL88_08955 [Sterolibacteriaceae bacterium MAG5]|nr:hypothetical protein [Candidatus Nitricoxidireducens bremensis]
MRHHCTPHTDIVELIGHDGASGFDYGPLTSALKTRQDLELENSAALSALMIAKIHLLLEGLFIVETEEILRAPPGFRLILA